MTTTTNEKPKGLYLYDDMPCHGYGIHLINYPEKYIELKSLFYDGFF